MKKKVLTSSVLSCMLLNMTNIYNKLTVYVPKEIVANAKRYALDNNTSLSEIVRKHLASLQAKNK